MHPRITEGPSNVLWADFPRHMYTVGYGLPDMNRYGYQGPLQVSDATEIFNATSHDRITRDTVKFRAALLILQLAMFAILASIIAKSFPQSSYVTMEHIFLLVVAFWLLKWEVNIWRARKRREKRAMRYLYCPSTARETPQ